MTAQPQRRARIEIVLLKRRMRTVMVVAAIALIVSVAVAPIGLSLAVFTASRAPAASFVADQLDPPTNLAATVSGGNVALGWTATADTYAAGHRVLRGTTSGGPYAQIAQLTPRTTTTYTDTPGAAALVVEVGSKWFCAPGNTACQVTDDNDIDIVSTISLGTFYYVARAFFQNWVSVNGTQISAVVGRSIQWSWTAGGHTVTACSNNTFSSCGAAQGFDSGTVGNGGTFLYMFSASGTFYYRCTVHPVQMRGQVNVSP